MELKDSLPKGSLKPLFKKMSVQDQYQTMNLSDSSREAVFISCGLDNSALN
jgi:hypothetical protein